MHLPFNAGYIKTLLHSFPEDNIIVVARQDHITNLKLLLPHQQRLNYESCDGFNYKNKNSFNPIWANREAKNCLETVKNIIMGKDVRLACIGGLEAGLLRCFRKKWDRVSSSPLHYILHGQLGGATNWRSRNPLYRFFDFKAEFNKKLPSSQKWVALEKGIEASVIEAFPKLSNNIITMPHPIDNIETPTSFEHQNHSTSSKMRVTFLGTCTQSKGFDVFLDVAKRLASEHYEFWAVGKDLSGIDPSEFDVLTKKPNKGYVPSDEYYNILEQSDLILLPYKDNYKFISSGSLLDAISYLKPVLTVRNKTHETLINQYGEFGIFVDNNNEIYQKLKSLSREKILDQQDIWQKSLRKIRGDRSPKQLAKEYRKHII